MITCVVEYVIDPGKIEAFKEFGRRWIELVDRHGGTHHGYYLPSEGASDRALALFSFPSLRSTRGTGRCSGLIQISSPQTRSGTRAAACCGTTARSCVR
jgi:NIPSNAP protein